jgi:hypothetical protein
MLSRAAKILTLSANRQWTEVSMCSVGLGAWPRAVLC